MVSYSNDDVEFYIWMKLERFLEYCFCLYQEIRDVHGES